LKNISQRLVQRILAQYYLPMTGIHGVSHWARVFENGTRVALKTGAKVEIVQLFALFHDAKRFNEGRDPDHGRRGADYVKALRASNVLNLSDEDFDLLYTACTYHTDGLTEHDVTVQACWDADRLDLNRVGILPVASRLCTSAAKSPELLSWANERAAKRFLPELVSTEWDIRM
jgi:uncharacterized protein